MPSIDAVSRETWQNLNPFTVTCLHAGQRRPAVRCAGAAVFHCARSRRISLSLFQLPHSSLSLSLSLCTVSPLGSASQQQQRGNWPSERARVSPTGPLSGSGFPIGQSTAPLGAGPSLKVTHPLFKHYSRL